MKNRTWIVKENGSGYDWELKSIDEVKSMKSEQEKIDDIEEYARDGDRMYMAMFLFAVVLLNSLVTAVLFGSLMRTFVLKAFPLAPVVYVNRETVVIMCWAVVWVTIIQVGTIIVHARIGRLLALDD